MCKTGTCSFVNPLNAWPLEVERSFQATGLKEEVPRDVWGGKKAGWYLKQHMEQNGE